MILIREGSLVPWNLLAWRNRCSRSQDASAGDAICVSLFQDAADAAEAWKQLPEVVQDSGLTRKRGIQRKFTSIRLVNGSSVEDYANELMSRYQLPERN